MVSITSVAAGFHRSLAIAFASLALALTPAAVSAQPPANTPSDGVRAGKTSRATSFASSEEVERMAIEQYDQLKRQARAKGALAPDDYPPLERLRGISRRLIPHAGRFNERAPGWAWEVNLLGSKQINAFCMPGGKIAFFTGIVNTLKLSDDEIAVVMGHEMAHALREHSRARLGKQRIAQGVTIGASVLSALLGYGDLGGQVASGAAQLTLLKYSRDDESEADLIGMDMAARAGYDPRAAVVLWQKMAAAAKGAPPQWLSTHPSHAKRIESIRRHLGEVMPLYARATGRELSALPAYASNFGEPVR